MFDHDLIRTLVYWFAFLVSAAFGNPIPEEVMIASAGVHAASMGEHGPFRWLLLPTVLLGALVADILLYALGRMFGARLLGNSVLDEAAGAAAAPSGERIGENFHRYGFVIFSRIGRLAPGIRTIPPRRPAPMRLSLQRLRPGLRRLRPSSAAVSSSFLGYALGESVRGIAGTGLRTSAASYKPLIFVILLGLVAAYLLFTFLRRPIPDGRSWKRFLLIGRQIAVHISDKDPGSTRNLSLSPGMDARFRAIPPPAVRQLGSVKCEALPSSSSTMVSWFRQSRGAAAGPQQLLALNGYFLRGGEAQANLVALDSHDPHADVVADDNFFAQLAREWSKHE